MAADRSANFVIKAKDAATGPLGKVGGAMGKLKSASVTAFKAIGAAALAAGAAIIAFTAKAVQGAIDDERSTILTNAALKARGFALDELGPKIEEQIKAAQRFGIEDERVRAGLEVGSRFFKNQTKLLKANELAMTISAVTGEDLESVMSKIGKAANGSTRGLAQLIGPIEKGATVSDLYAQGMGKFKEVADELANSTSGRFAEAQVIFNEQMEAFGIKFLPLVSEGLTFLVEKALPAFQDLLDTVGPILTDLVDDFVRPVIDSVAELFSLFEGSEGSISIIDLALLPLKATLEAIRIVIDLIVAGLKLIGVGGGLKTQRLDRAAAGAGYSGGPRATGGPMMGGGGGGGGGSSYLQVQNNITFGRDATSSVNTQLGQTATAAGRTRLGKRRP
jgi:hypothetical protein